jgi:hypothetical protein
VWQFHEIVLAATALGEAVACYQLNKQKIGAHYGATGLFYCNHAHNR